MPLKCDHCETKIYVDYTTKEEIEEFSERIQAHIRLHPGKQPVFTLVDSQGVDVDHSTDVLVHQEDELLKSLSITIQ